MGSLSLPSRFSLSIQSPLNHLPPVAKSQWVSLDQSPSLELSLDITLSRGTLFLLTSSFPGLHSPDQLSTHTPSC